MSDNLANRSNGRRYSSVIEMVCDLSDDPSFAAGFARQLVERRSAKRKTIRKMIRESQGHEAE